MGEELGNRHQQRKCAAILVLLGGIVVCSSSAQTQNTNPPSPTPLPSMTNVRDDTSVETLRSEVSELKKKVEKPPKDLWDKLTAMSGLVSAALVAFIAFYATNLYNHRQKKLEEHRKDQELLIAQIQTVEKFFPHLSSIDEKIKGGALTAIAALGNEDLAVRLAKTFSGSGATGALTTIASTATGAVAAKAESALLDVLAYLKPRVITVQQGTQRRATGFVVSSNGLIVTTAHAINGIPADELMVGLPNGTQVPATIVKTDIQKDLALLEGKTNEILTPFDLSPATPNFGEPITALLIGLKSDLRTQIGTVVGLDEDIVIPGVGSTMSRIAVNLPVEPGSSGTPVVDKEGRLLGLVQAWSAQGITLLIPAAEAIAFVGV